MPDGVTHWALTKNLPVPYGLLAGSLFYTHSGDLTLSAVVGASVFAGSYISARWLSPDVDVNGRTFNERGWSGRIVQVLTFPYSLLPHRGITHTPVLGAALIYAPLLLLLLVLTQLAGVPLEVIPSFYAGAALTDWVHIQADHDKVLRQQIKNRDRYSEE